MNMIEPGTLVGAGYMTGFGSHWATEAVPGALPTGCNSPQKVAFGLYAEQLSATAFTAPRAENRRSWFYRLRPSSEHARFEPIEGDAHADSGNRATILDPNRLRWDPLPLPETPTDFVDGMHPMVGTGDPRHGAGYTVYLYCATRSMERIFFSADGELLIVPQSGRLDIATEFGRLEVGPRQIAVIPRGVRFRIALPEGSARGYALENHGQLLRLPELGPIGANGLANPRDFEVPVAAFEDDDGPVELVQRFAGRLWRTTLDHSPLDVVAWHGNLAPYRYDLDRFNVMNTVSYDHPDPSIFTVLTSPSGVPGTANIDFVIFPPRWMVAENTFRPPWYHRNVMSEFMGLIDGAYDAKAEGFLPGGASLHNCMSAHGPDRATYSAAVAAELAPMKLDQGMAFMFEGKDMIAVTPNALQRAQRAYDACWSGMDKADLRVPA